MPTNLVLIILKPPMTERFRRAEKPGKQQEVFIRPGIEGFADGMSIFPRLKEWENQIALQALREGKTVDQLRTITPFRQYINAASRANNVGKEDPFTPFTNLFDASPGIDQLVSYGNFHTIRTWTWTFAQRHPATNLPLEQFFQDALYTIIPSQARAYDPSFGNSFQNFAVQMLKKRFSSFVNEQKREHSSPVWYEQKQAAKKGRPKASKERVVFARLDAPMPHVETPQTFFDYVESTRSVPQDTTQAEDQEAREKIRLIAQLAGLTDIQEETLIALYVYGGDTKLIAQMRRCTTRMVRMYRQEALSKLEELGYETVQAVLTGTYPTLESAKEGQVRKSPFPKRGFR